GGFGTLLLVPLTLALVPRPSGRPLPSRATARPRIPLVLRSRAVWVIGFSFVGLEGASLSAGQFFVPYAEAIRGWTPALAGLIGSLFVFPSLFGGPVGGWLAERFTNRRTQLALLTAGPSLMLILLPWLGWVAVAVVATVFAFAVGMVYAIMYILPPYLPGIRSEDVPLAIGLFNGIQLAGGAAVAAVVGAIVATFGYDPAWWFLGAIAALTLAALPLLPATGPRHSESTPTPGSDR
ncbi:MAG: MFS transporter, partial [Thermoplasmata archaeon]